MKGKVRVFKHSFMGINAIDKENKVCYLFRGNKYQVVPFSIIEEVCQEYKGVNVVYKPYNILCYQQYVKTSNYGIKGEDVNREEFIESLKDYEKVELK